MRICQPNKIFLYNPHDPCYKITVCCVRPFEGVAHYNVRFEKDEREKLRRFIKSWLLESNTIQIELIAPSGATALYKGPRYNEWGNIIENEAYKIED